MTVVNRPAHPGRSAADPHPPPAWPPVRFHIDLSVQRASRRAEQCAAALAADPPPSAPHRIALLSVLAASLSSTAPAAAARHLAAAEALAATAGSDPGARVYLLLARYALDLSPQALPRRLRFAREALSLLAGERCAPLRADVLPTAYFMYVGALLETGDMRAVDEALSPEEHPADHLTALLEGPGALWFRCARATMEGRLDLAEWLAGQARDQAAAGGDVDADAVFVGQIAVIRWIQGRVSEMEQTFLRLRQAMPADPVWEIAVAWIWQHQGRAEAARGLIESLPPAASWPRGRNWLAAVALLAEVAAEVGSDTLVEELYRELEPFADRLVPIGLGVTGLGTVARFLALLAVRRRRWAEAERRYRDAIALAARLGAQVWLARSQVELAAVLAGNGERVAAAGLAGESRAAARHLALRDLEEQADLLLDRIAAAGPGPTTGARAPEIGARPADLGSEAPRITILGEFGVRLPGGEAAVFPSRKSQTLLKLLLARRGAPLARESAIDVLWPGGDPYQLSNRLSVAMTALRRVLDPHRAHPPDTYLVATRETLRLRTDRLSVDVEDFLKLAERARSDQARAGATPDAHRDRIALMRRALHAYGGDAFAEDPYESWAEHLRRHAHLVFFALAHDLADDAAGRGDHLERVELYRRVLQTDPFDLRAHDGLVAALAKLAAPGQLAAARIERDRRRAELGLSDRPR